jgi:hypothetical protein
MAGILIFKESIVLFEALAAITGFITWRKWRNNCFKWFPIYLSVLFLCECAGYFFGATKNYYALDILYNFFVVPLEISFICWLFYKNLSEGFKKTILALWFIYFVSLVLDHTIFNNRDYIFRSVSYSIGNMVILILTLCYFISLALSSDILYFRNRLMFWISIGFLVFYLGTFPYFGLYNLMAKKYMSSFINYTWVMIFLNYIMYILFTLGFLWGKSK